jgi:predicted  nucleic acid-binding Zn-ribbon protein
MSEEVTKDMPDRRPFEERVLLALEAIDARLANLEDKVERRMHDTRPIWERALTEIIEVNKRLASMERKMDVLGKDVLNLRADLSGVDERLRKIEGDGTILIG